MDKVNKNTRAGKRGKLISCPHCKATSIAYHFSWSASKCETCKKYVDKCDWLIGTGHDYAINNQGLYTRGGLTTKRPTLNLEDPITKERVEILFGYLKGEPMATIFLGDSDMPIVMLSQDILGIAFGQGWEEENCCLGRGCPTCEEEGA